MKFEAMMGKKKVVVELLSFVGDQEQGYIGKFGVTGKTKGDNIDSFDHYIPPLTGNKTIDSAFFDKVSKLPQFKTAIVLS